jgi:hypothetical protein
MNKGRENESKWISVTQQQPRHAYVTECHHAAYHLLVSSSYRPNFLPSVQIIFPDRTGFSEKCVLPSLFHIKVKKWKDNSEGREITTGGKSERICCIKTDEHGGRARERGVVFHPFLRRNFALSHPLCTPCGHCRPSVTRSRDRAVSRRFFKLSMRTHDS